MIGLPRRRALDRILGRALSGLLLLDVVLAAPAAGQRPTSGGLPSGGARPERAIRRDLPLTPMIRRAFAAGTRDSTGRPGSHYWQLWVDYTIDARLDPATSTVTGRERVVIHNPSDSALHTVVLRLDQNLFTPHAPRARYMSDITEGLQLTRLTVDGQPIDLTQRDIAWQLRRTSAAIPLPTPIAARGRATLEIDWHFEVPTAGASRLGRWDDTLYQVAQWYPRVAVYDDLRAGGWDREPYLGEAEFYNNYGRFDVRLDVPAGWLVGATGVLQNPEAVLTPAARARLARVLTSDSVRAIVSPTEVGPGRATAAGAATGGRLVWRFVADSVSDFAWATASRYVWDAARVTIPGQGAIPFHILYLPGHAEQYADAGPVGRRALEFYSQLLMPYAYPQLTMVNGPAGAMEYPMFIMSDVKIFADHEIGHQWWPMMVGSNETWYPFMDEGFSSYVNALASAAAEQRPPRLDGWAQAYGNPAASYASSGDERAPPLMWNANYGGSEYGFQAYQKAPMMLAMLGGIVGDSAVQRALSAYAQAWRFKHPSPWDFAFFMNTALGQDLGWFWYYWLFTTESVDGVIEEVTTRGRRTTVTVRQDGQMPSPVVLQVEFAAEGPAIQPMPNSRMLDSVTAVVTYPVDVWFSGRRTFVAELDFGGRRIERITFDPRGRFPDRDPTDNVWPRPTTTAHP